MSETPQRHSHKGTGDGGAIDFAARVGEDSLVDSGTLTVPQNSTATATVSGLSRNSFPLLSAHPDDSWNGGFFGVNNILDQVGTGAAAAIQYNTTADEWQVVGFEGDNSEVTITWEVYEL